MFASRSAGGSPLKSPSSSAQPVGDDEDTDEWAPKAPVAAPPSFVPRGPRPLGMPSPSGPIARSASPALSDGTTASTATRSSGVPAPLSLDGGGGPDRCPRCQTVVYFAERMQAAGRVWHKRCLRCTSCSKALDSHLVVSGNDPYCKQCHSKIGGLAEAGIMSVRREEESMARRKLTMLQNSGRASTDVHTRTRARPLSGPPVRHASCLVLSADCVDRFEQPQPVAVER